MTSRAEELAQRLDQMANIESNELADLMVLSAAELLRLASEVDSLKLDAERYQALKTRHAFLIVRRLLGHSGYSTVTAHRYIDQYADNAIADVKAHDESKENTHG